MTLTPAYGETPVPDDDLDSLLALTREALGDPVSRAALYDVEQSVLEDVAEHMVNEILGGKVSLDELLSDHFLRALHRQLYGSIWTWAGVFRKRELNLGVAPWQIAVELRDALETIRYRWSHTDDWSPRELGMAAHAETVRIHPFTDGNGRTTRLLGDLVFIAAQDGDSLEQYDWALDKPRYISLLRQYDAHRDPRELAAFVAVRPLGE